MSQSRKKTAPTSVGSEMLFARLGPITYRRPEELIAYTRHTRKHPERQLVSLSASIREFGFNAPVLVDGDGLIIAGHGRVEAAKRIGLAEVPTISATHLSPAQVRAYRLADNRIYDTGAWDLEALVVELQDIVSLDEIEVESMGWSTGEIDVLRKSASGCSSSAFVAISAWNGPSRSRPIRAGRCCGPSTARPNIGSATA